MPITSRASSRNARSSVSSDIPRHSWYALGLLFCASILNTLDKSLIPALSEPIRTEFNLSDSQFGMLAGTVFAVPYAICAIPISLLIDRLNRARFLASLLAVWSGATILGGFSSTFSGLIAARIGVAAAESGGNPTSLSLISDLFPDGKRGRAIGIFGAHSAIGIFLAFSIAGYFAAQFGWRTAFFVAGAPGVILALIIWLTVREPVRGGAVSNQDADARRDRSGLRAIWAAIRADRTLLLLAAAAILSVAGQAGIGAFVASFFVRIHDVPLGQAGLISGIILGFSGAAGAVTGGLLADRMSVRSPGAGCRLVSLLTLAAMPFAVLGFASHALGASITLLLIYQFLVSTYAGATFGMIMRLAPAAVRGAIVGFVVLAMNLAGYGLGPQLAGIMSDIFAWAGETQPLRWALCSVTFVFCLSSALYFLVARRLDAPSAP